MIRNAKKFAVSSLSHMKDDKNLLFFILSFNIAYWFLIYMTNTSLIFSLTLGIFLPFFAYVLTGVKVYENEQILYKDNVRHLLVFGFLILVSINLFNYYYTNVLFDSYSLVFVILPVIVYILSE